MYILDIDKLQVGDILLTSEKAFVSKSIRIATNSDFSHAILYIGNYSYIHSDRKGVHSSNIQRLLFDETSRVCVLRITDKDIATKSCEFAKIQIGTEYSIKEAIRTKLEGKEQKENRQFCSRLVAQSYEKAGLKIVKNSEYCTPNELYRSEHTHEIKDCLKVASERDILIANSPNKIDLISQNTNDMFSKIRSLTQKDIQNTEQLIRFIVENPEYDQSITKLHEESGFLNNWHNFVRPYHYNYDEFLKLDMPDIDKAEFAKIEIQKTSKMKDSSMDSLLFYQKLKKEYSLDFASMMENYYDLEIKRLNIRIDICNKYLERQF